MNSGPAGVRYWNISEVWVVEEKVSISLSPLPSPNPCGTKARPVCQAVEVCCRMPSLGWPVQQHDFNQKRGQREGRKGEVTCLIHTLNGVVDRRSQECSEKALSSGVTWVIIMKISLENTHCLLHCLCLIQHGPKFLLVDYTHTFKHTHTNSCPFAQTPFLSFFLFTSLFLPEDLLSPVWSFVSVLRELE